MSVNQNKINIRRANVATVVNPGSKDINIYPGQPFLIKDRKYLLLNTGIVTKAPKPTDIIIVRNIEGKMNEQANFNNVAASEYKIGQLTATESGILVENKASDKLILKHETAEDISILELTEDHIQLSTSLSSLQVASNRVDIKSKEINIINAVDDSILFKNNTEEYLRINNITEETYRVKTQIISAGELELKTRHLSEDIRLSSNLRFDPAVRAPRIKTTYLEIQNPASNSKTAVEVLGSFEAGKRNTNDPTAIHSLQVFEDQVNLNKVTIVKGNLIVAQPQSGVNNELKINSGTTLRSTGDMKAVNLSIYKDTSDMADDKPFFEVKNGKVIINGELEVNGNVVTTGAENTFTVTGNTEIGGDLILNATPGD